MLRVIDADLARSRPRCAIEVYMGDCVDRGPDSRATLDILFNRSRNSSSVLRDPSLLTSGCTSADCAH
jgi:serine/threonine protein phosphatase 1